MIDSPDKILLEKILKFIPSHIKPVNYLMEKLGLSKDSVYRRLKQEIGFTYEEAVILSRDLKFSLDYNYNGDISSTNYINFSIKKTDTVQDTIRLLQYESEYLYKKMIRLSLSKNPEMIITQNNIHILPIEYHETLFRFFYYKWLHLLGIIPMDYPFSQITVPESIITYVKNQELLHSIDNVTFIIDSNKCKNTIKDIQYFYRQGLIGAEEIQLLKAELIEEITYEPRRLLKKHPLSRKYLKCYLSDFNMSTNTLYSKDEDVEESTFWLYSIIPQRTGNHQICTYHREWLETFKRYSTLITGSGGIVLSRWISDQMECVKNMDKIMY